jgi:hypothetical protein
MTRILYYYYKIHCDTDNKNVYIWSKDKPTKCPENRSHTISSTTIVDKKILDMTELLEEFPSGEPTGGRFRCDGFNLSISGNSTAIRDFSWAYPISGLTIRFNTDEIHRGDIINGYSIPTAFLGHTNNDITIGSTVIPVKSEYISNFTVGMEIVISDTQNTETLGKLTSIDTNNNTITVQNATTLFLYKNAYISHHTPIGALTQTLNAGDNWITCTPTVISLVQKGMILFVSDGTNKEKLGEVFEIDISNNKIMFQDSPINNYSAGSYIYPQVQVIKNYTLAAPNIHIIGEGKIGGSYISKLYLMRIEYKNNSSDSKNFSWYSEILY